MADLLPPGSSTPAAADAAERIAAAERRLGHPLPRDLRDLHMHCGRVVVCGYRFLAPDEIRPIAELQVGDDSDDWAPRTWIAVVDSHDSDYVGLDLIQNADGSHNWLDNCHDTIGEATIIATSLDEFVREVVAHPAATYWLRAGHPTYRKIVYEHPPSSIARWAKTGTASSAARSGRSRAPRQDAHDCTSRSA